MNNLTDLGIKSKKVPKAGIVFSILMESEIDLVIYDFLRSRIINHYGPGVQIEKRYWTDTYASKSKKYDNAGKVVIWVAEPQYTKMPIVKKHVQKSTVITSKKTYNRISTEAQDLIRRWGKSLYFVDMAFNEQKI